MFKLKALPVWVQPFLLLVIAIAAYGVVIPWLGFYWDDWAFLFIRTQLGAEGLARYFSTNRPFIAWIPQLTIPLIGPVAWKWQVFHLVVRAAAAISLWQVIRMTWRKAGWMAFWAAALWLVYPSFDQQPIAINYSDFFILFIFLMLSFMLSIWAAQKLEQRWPWLLAACVLALVNHLALDYFLMLEFLRPVLIYFSLNDDQAPRRARVRKSLLVWLPNLLVWLGVFVWRFWFFPFQTQNYQLGLLSRIKTEPLMTLLQLGQTVVGDIVKVWFGAWANAFRFPSFQSFGARSSLLYAGVMLGLTVLLWLAAKAGKKGEGETSQAGFVWLGAGLWGMAIAGWPFWATEIPIGLIFTASRFTLPFIPGAVLAICGLLMIVLRSRSWQYLLLALLVGVAAGYQIRVATEYRRDWNMQRNLFWQLSWRAPAIEKGTVVVANDTPIRFASDNSLVSPLNWLYSPENHSERLDYMFFYPSIRLERGLNNFVPNMPIEKDYLGAAFSGSTNQVITIHYEPPGCMRVLDPEVDLLNPLLPGIMRESLRLSDPAHILPEGAAEQSPLLKIFGAEPAHGWCYYFEKAELARQQADWPAVVELAEQAAASGDYPNDPTERFVFIEGYAHQGEWEKAFEWSRQSAGISPLVEPMVCRLWQRIEKETAELPSADLDALRQELQCIP